MSQLDLGIVGFSGERVPRTSASETPLKKEVAWGKLDLHPRTLRRNIWRLLLSATEQEIRDGLAFYLGAHGLCRLFALANGSTVRQVAGIYAALSPMNTWDTNVSNVLDVLRHVAGLRRAAALCGPSLDSLRVNTPHVNREKAVSIALGADPLSVLKGRKVTAFFKAIADPEDTQHVPVDRHMLRLALGKDFGKNELSRLTGNQSIYSKVEAAYLDVGRREGIGNRVASVAWFVQRRILAGQEVFPAEGAPICCGVPSWSHGKLKAENLPGGPRAFYCPSCRRTRRVGVAPRKLAQGVLLDVIAPGSVTIEKSSGRPRVHLGVGHPFANTAGWQYLARWVVMAETGERLRSDEHVHHEDGVFKNCQRSNLAVWVAEEHGRFHGRKQLLYMLRDVTSGRFLPSAVPTYQETGVGGREEEIPF